MRLKEIMSTNVQSVAPGELLEQARTRMLLHGIHHLVVTYRHRVVGLITSALLETRAAEGVARVGDAMARNIITASPGMTVRQAANMMRGRPEGALPVLVGEELVGIVTVSDLLDVLGRGTDRRSAKQRATLPHRGLVPRALQSHVRRA